MWVIVWPSTCVVYKVEEREDAQKSVPRHNLPEAFHFQIKICASTEVVGRAFCDITQE